MDLIVYHKNCPDGFTAAFVAKTRYPEAELLGATYGEPAPIDAVRNKHVLVVDFSWSRPIVEEMIRAAEYIRFLDHHKTAEEALRGLPNTVFDMNRSGAGMTWDELFGGPRPWWVDYVEDRDLWNWKLPASKEVSGYIMSLPHTLEAYATLMDTSLDYAVTNGAGILKQINHYVEKVSAEVQTGVLAGYKTGVVNAPYTNISELCNELCSRAGFQIGLGWFERGDGLVQFSLRSVGNIDVSAIAKAYGGGGHKNAAGFEMGVPSSRIFIDNVLGRTFGK